MNWHIKPENWRCDKHCCEKTMIRQGDEWLMICIQCETERIKNEIPEDK